MQIGAIFPQTEIGPDPAAIRDYVQAVEEMQFDYLFIADHVLGADPAHHEHVRGSYYTHHSVIHESLTTLAFIAALTTRIRLITGILILPQRQTALVAKQPPRLTRSAADGLRWVSASVGITLSSRPSARISPTAASARKSRST